MMELLATLGILWTIWFTLFAGVSAVLSLAWRPLWARITHWHPSDRAVALFAIATAPAVIPTCVAVILAAPGLVGLAVPGLDHCDSHPEHAHLCLVHPTAPLLPLLVGALLASVAAGAAVAGRTIHRVSRTNQPLRALARLVSNELSGRVALVESERPFAITYGLVNPRTLISRALIESLSPVQRAAVFAHEAEHMRRRDPLRYLTARFFTALLWPSVRSEVLRELLLSAEQICDEQAARRIGDRLRVADAILAVEKLVAGHRVARQQVGSGIEGGSVPARVSNLLDERPRGCWKGRWLLVAVGGGLIVAAQSLHHEAEHLLSLILGAH